MISKGKVKKAAIQPSIRQKIWSYMRRNRVFMISDVMAITGANYKYLREMFKVYEATGYIKVLKRGKPFSSTQLKLIKCTGVKVPTHDKKSNTVFDYNTEEEIFIHFPSTCEKVLKLLNKNLLSKEEINEAVDLSFKTRTDCYAKLKSKNVMVRTSPIQRDGLNRILYSVDLDKVKTMQDEFETQKHEYQKRINEANKSSDSSKTVKVSDDLLKLLDAMTKTKMSKRGLDEAAGLNLGFAKNYWDRFIDKGVVAEIKPIQREGKRVLFRVYPNKAKKLKEDLLKGEKL